jgi:hypothetical protein
MCGSDDRTVASERNTVKRFRIAGIMPFAALAGGRVEEKDAIREADGADVPKAQQQHVR